MLSYVGIAFLGAVILFAWSNYRSFSKNLAAAKASNIRYVIVPFYYHSPVWVLIQPVLMPILRKLPKSWTFPWLNVLPREFTWDHLFSIYKDLGADSFIVVSPGGNMLWTADAQTIVQITTRRNDFPKPVWMYSMLDIYGKNLVSSEGQIWRTHRKITSPPFTEKSNHAVWAESIRQSEFMLEAFTGPDGQKSPTIENARKYSLRVSLNVISCVGFGKQLSWPSLKDTKDERNSILKDAQTSSTDDVVMNAGHSMPYNTALEVLLDHILIVIVIPRSILKLIPLKRTRLAYQSFTEWKMYMNEMFQAKKAEVISGREQVGLDLMGALIKGSGITDKSAPLSSEVEKGRTPPKQLLSDEEIIGNAFVFLVAGHETTANSIEFSFLYLAMNVSSQRHLQKDLDAIFNGRPSSEWDYERDIPKLFSSMAGAVMNEELRLIPPAPNIPKCTLPNMPQRLVVDGKECIVPADTQIHICALAVHRNPKYWPSNPPSDPKHLVHPTSNADNDLEEFRPERWLQEDVKTIKATIDNQKTSSKLDAQSATKMGENLADLGIDTTSDTAANLYSPMKGAYLPFSEGYRACIGRRFAQVEILAVLAVIFTQYSVELAVDDWATDEEVEKMNEEERRELWWKAKNQAMQTMRTGMLTAITIQLRKGKVPLKFVRRGKERFDF